MVLNISMLLEISVAVIAAAVTVLTVTSTVIMTLLLRRQTAIGEKIDAVQSQVTTKNTKSMANLADDDEDRRIEAVPASERTAEDREHLAAP